VEASVSVWVEDAGEVFAVNPDLRLFPASNQKIVTAVGAFMLLDLDSGFHTSVEERSGELIVRAGGDPTLLTNGPHSLKALAAQVADNASGDFVRLVIDAGHFERRVTVLGRLDWQLPTYTGPLSGFIVDDNRWTTDPAFLANPALVNGQRFAEALDREGIGISEVVHIDNYGLLGGNVASLESEPAGALIPKMMKSSDNEIAESLLREMGAGSTATGVVEVQRVLTSLCLSGSAGDGSGLSRANLISARELRRILQFAMNQEWGDQFYQSFPVAGLSGTMATRLTGIATSGNVRAKTGTIIGGRALSGFASTTDDRFMTFSVITNGDAGAAAASAAAIDALVTALTSVRP
jgi:D-alanyl-D-alanine carboxypeptidase/D-alanyl-D-alanine-endopeptidase (penicillin-binding protein 4)